MKLPAGFTSLSKKPASLVKDDLDKALDEALRESFPASDPIAVSIESHAPKENHPSCSDEKPPARE
jgi:hypothetical protein